MGGTEDRDDSLHNRAGQWAAHKGRLRKSSPARPFVQPAGPALCYVQPSEIHIFHLETRPSSPPAEMIR